MVALILIILLGVPLIIATCQLLIIAFWASSDLFGLLNSPYVRFLARIAFLVIAVAISLPLSGMLAPLLPDLSTIGDGGVGIAKNSVAQAAVYLLLPCFIMLVPSVLAKLTLKSKQARPAPPGNRNEDASTQSPKDI